MRRKDLIPWAGIAIAMVVAAAVAWAGSQHGRGAFGMPVFALCGGIAFLVNWAAFVPAYLRQTEHYYDLTGSLTYLGLLLVALGLSGPPDPRALLLAALVAIWALRLGSFLFARIQREGSDARFDRIKPNFARFLMTWTLQGLWVFLTLSCALAAMTSLERVPLGLAAGVGLVIWLVGFAIEAIADRQKRVFRADPANRDRFVSTGLWAWSRHPNYFGEITLWVGIAVLALPALRGWQLLTLISPVFVFFLLTRISGVPLLEARSDERWSGDPDYAAYKARTPVLFPRPPSPA